MHEAREDIVLFPALHKVVPAGRLKELGEQFEKEEDKLFGEEGSRRRSSRSPPSRSTWASTTSPRSRRDEVLICGELPGFGRVPRAQLQR
jgi:hypothetical protein